MVFSRMVETFQMAQPFFIFFAYQMSGMTTRTTMMATRTMVLETERS